MPRSLYRTRGALALLPIPSTTAGIDSGSLPAISKTWWAVASPLRIEDRRARGTSQAPYELRLGDKYGVDRDMCSTLETDATAC